MTRIRPRSHGTVYSVAASCALAAMVSAGAAQAADDTSTGTGGDEHGPILLNAKIGPAIGIAEFSGFNAFVLELEGGYAIIGNEGYLTFSPNFAFGTITLITLPVGFQYGVELPVEHLTAYGRLGLGITFATEGGDPVFHVGPHFGAKYQLTEMFHVGAEPLSLPIYFNENGVGMQYRFMAYGGADF